MDASEGMIAMFVARRNLLLIGENELQCRPMARSLRLLCPVETRALRTSAPLPAVVPDAVIVSGVAFRRGGVLGDVQKALRPFLDSHVPVLCLLDNPSARDDLQARALGASAVLAADTPLRRVADVLGQLTSRGGGLRRVERAQAVEAAVTDVGLAVADLMTAAAAGRDVGVGVTAEASRLLLGTVRDNDVGRWMETVSLVHDQSYRHCLLMAGIMAAFVVSLGFKPMDCDRLTRAAILHDVGKALVPTDILNKPGPLTDAEMALMRQHPNLGYELLLAQGDHHETTLRIARHHHEYLDGSGYPSGLAADRIGDEVRIATICDVFTALIERRSYKSPLTATEAAELMVPMQGRLDPDLLRLFFRLFVSADTTH